MGYIYRIWHKESGKSYIGQSVYHPMCKDGRIERHLKLRTPLCPCIHNAIAKYGANNFDYEILYDDVHEIDLDDFERLAITKYNSLSPNGYNLTMGGRGGRLSEKTRKKMSASRTGKRGNFTGKKHTEEAKRKISNAGIGKRRTPRHWAWTYASDIVDMYFMYKKNTIEISEKFGCTPFVISKIIKSVGLTPRDAKFQKGEIGINRKKSKSWILGL